METRDQSIWSVGVGRCLGASIKLHLFFAAFVLVTFAWACLGQAPPKGDPMANIGIATAALVTLALSLLVHEAGHFLACFRAGGHVHGLTLMPWGGSYQTDLESPASRTVFYLAGPVANLSVALACLFAIQFFTRTEFDWSYLNPMQPLWALSDPAYLLGLKFAFWVNWLLFLVNLLPGFPFDGGFTLPAALQTLAPRLDYVEVARVSMIITAVTAIALLVFAIGYANTQTNELYPSWLILLPLAMTLFFSSRLYSRFTAEGMLPAWIDEEVEDAYTYAEEMAFYDEEYFEEEEDESISDWLQERQKERERNARVAEEEEEQRADAILAKLHKQGIESLTDDERSVLQRLSVRYRNRTREGA